ncbi:hypothetical protein MYA98_07730 [Salmonella sp. WGH-01]|nr:hypothetical protein MYA98_07730 [Salmonella sp. WGH-01]
MPIRLGRGNYSQNRAGGSDSTNNSDMLLTPIAPPADAKVFAYHYSGSSSGTGTALRMRAAGCSLS